MEPIACLLVSGVLALFGLVVYAMIRSVKKDAAKKAETAGSLGFAAIEPDAALLEKIAFAYRPNREPAGFELKNVFRKVILDGEMFLFDLDDTSGDDTSALETQAVAVISPQLKLPQFGLFPQADMEGWAVNLANRVMRFAVSHAGTLLEFPEFPDFQRKYLLASFEPEEARRFFEPQIVEQLAQTRYLNMQGRGDLFILSSMDPGMRSKEQNPVTDRIGKAMQVFRILQQGGRQG